MAKDILEENHIVLLEDEKVTPDTSEELSDNNTIIISKETEDVVTSEKVEKSSDVSTEDVLDNYSKIDKERSYTSYVNYLIIRDRYSLLK